MSHASLVSRTFEVENSPSVQSITALVMAPVQQAGNDDYQCAYEVLVNDETRRRSTIHGVDSWQAFLLALMGVSQDVESLIEHSGGSVDGAYLRELSVLSALCQKTSLDEALRRSIAATRPLPDDDEIDDGARRR